VLPVGAVRDKVLAAHRAGIKQVLLPKDNENDLADIPEDVRRELEITLVENVDEVLNAALNPEPAQDEPAVAPVAAG
jgi:ATP-dependent Lon protease